MNRARVYLNKFYRFYGTEERFFLIFGLIFGLIFLFLIPPMQGPDEPNHYLRVNQIAEGNIFSDYVDNSVGGFMPTLEAFKVNVGGSMPDGIVKLAHYRYDEFHGHPDIKFSKSDLLAMKAIRNSGQDVAVSFANTAAYSPVAYLPSLVGVFLGKIFNANPLILFYLARISSLLIGLGLLVLAIRIIPFGKLPMAVLALLPMTIGQLATISADTTAIVFSFLAAAITLKYAFSQVKLNRLEIINLLGIYVLLGFAKPSLALIGLFGFVLLVNKSITGWPRAFLPIACFVAALIPALLWNGVVKDATIFGYGMSYHASNYAENISYVIHNLENVPIIIFNSFLINSFQVRVPTAFIGTMGWQDAPLLQIFMIVGYVSLFASIFISTGSNNNLQRWVKILSFSVGGLIIMATIMYMYLLTAVPGDQFADGIQGRYFIPAAPLIALAFINRKKIISQNFYQIYARRCLIISVILLMAMTTSIIYRYWVTSTLT